VVICLEQGADLHTAQLMPLPLAVSCFSKIQIGFTFLVPAHPGSPGKRPFNGCVCVCVCVCVAGCKVDARDQYGCTAVYFAAKLGHADVVRQLIIAGADLNVADTKAWTPLASK